ncbi:MAG: hypothetical protein MR426_07415, partial [Clostridiales bacterium]|nr:hypothetical protein [Clostridiales bacterium]
RAFSSGVRFFLAICKTSNVVLLFYTTSEVYTKFGMVSKWIRPALFTLGGALLGLGYYAFVGCSTGSCAITSNPLSSMLYMGLVGWLLSGVIGKECDGGCNM